MCLTPHLVTWKTILRHIQPVGLNLEQKLAEELDPDFFSQTSRQIQKAILKEILGEISEYIDPILKSVDEVSVIMLVKFCKFRSSCLCFCVNSVHLVYVLTF